MRKVITLTLAALFALGAFAAPTGWKIIKEIKIGGDGGWDYLTMDTAHAVCTFRTTRTSSLSILTPAKSWGIYRTRREYTVLPWLRN